METSCEDQRRPNSGTHRRWKDRVKARDGYRCRSCGSAADLSVHHVWDWHHNTALRYADGNGITLCGRCHRQVENRKHQRQEDPDGPGLATRPKT